MTPAARAFAHVEYLTILYVSGARVGLAVAVGAVDGAVKVIGLIPAVIAYAESEDALMDVMLHWLTSEDKAPASAESTVSEYRTFIAIQFETYEHLFSGGNHVLGS